MDRLVTQLLEMNVGDIAGKHLCLTDGYMCHTDISPGQKLREVIDSDFDPPYSFALYRSGLSKEGFAVLGVVVNNLFIKPGEMNARRMNRFFPVERRSDIDRAEIAKYNTGEEVVVLQ